MLRYARLVLACSTATTAAASWMNISERWTKLPSSLERNPVTLVCVSTRGLLRSWLVRSQLRIARVRCSSFKSPSSAVLPPSSRHPYTFVFARSPSSRKILLHFQHGIRHHAVGLAVGTKRTSSPLSTPGELLASSRPSRWAMPDPRAQVETRLLTSVA